jgi:hypothetical protein
MTQKSLAKLSLTCQYEEGFWFPFEPNRWLSNEKLSLVSLEAKGLWIHLVCLIYKANAGGRLVINGNPPTPEQISRMVGQNASPLLKELEVAGVYEIKDGAIFHGGTAATLADMNKRSAGYASRITHRCSKDEPSMHHLSSIDEQKMGHNNNNNNNNNNNKRKRERAYALRTLNGLPLLKRLGGGRRMRSQLLITTRATDGRSGERRRLRIGERAQGTVSGETKTKRKEAISCPLAL